MKSLFNWIENRTGIGALTHAALYEHVPGGARWRYVWGSTLVFAFSCQLITGTFLWMSYSPSSQTAWESVYYIQYEMYGGWLLRGLHHFMAQAMVVLLALHLVQVVVDGAYRAPREMNFWLGLILMQIVLGLSLTGYLLPWDQKGYWATIVATNLASNVPYVGEDLQRLVVGGSDYGHYTLTRFFALHAGVLPGLLIAFLVAHVLLFRRHGLTPKQPLRGADGWFWPDQLLRDAVACFAVLAVVLFVTILPGMRTDEGLRAVMASPHPGDHLGAELGAPADAASPYSAARPEWYFLFLFQFLKLFEFQDHKEFGELLGSLIIPGAVLFLMFLMPIVGRWKLGHRFNVGGLACLFIGVVVLTGRAVWDDRHANWVIEPDKNNIRASERWHMSHGYLDAVDMAEAEAHRAVELARALGIPSTGALSLLRNDPKTRGPALFADNCAACHNHLDRNGYGVAAPDPSAPNLYGFASRAWIEGLLDPAKIATPEYFGNTSHKDGDMVGYVTGDDFAKLSAEERKQIAAALSAEAKLPVQAAADSHDAEMIAAGVELIKGKAGCTDCHHFHEEGDLGSAPDLTGYGSAEWLAGMIGNPEGEAYYADNNDRMPAFAAGDDPSEHRLNKHDMSMMVDWLRGTWFKPAAATDAAPEAPADEKSAPAAADKEPDPAAKDEKNSE